jgi:hypothetical protein
MMQAFQPRSGKRGPEDARDVATRKDTITVPTVPCVRSRCFPRLTQCEPYRALYIDMP